MLTNEYPYPLFLELVSIHPLTEFEELYFVDLLEHSLSLSVAEKKRVVDAVPTLSQFQINELVKVFEDEREEFKKLFAKEGDTIRELIDKAKEGWIQLHGIYLQEKQERERTDTDTAQIDDIKKSLGI